ncbi:MAG: LacI family DNA-binding transcriptional regulator [Gemmatimonadota bacterium]|nr:LacI family DNA-binding transcriptional regulator [Gemmatimonadota bacterium]
MTKKRPTISDVAREANVSKATVSAVLNDKASVAETTRNRVREVIERLNYRPTAGARRRSGEKRAKSIGLLIKEADNPFYTEIITAARARAASGGYTLLVASSEGEAEAEREIFDLLRAKEVDGLIVNPVFDHEADLTPIFELKRRNVPLVLLEEIRGVRASLMDIDNVDAARRAAEHLIDLGHDRIVHFGGPRYSIHSDQRVAGVRRAFSESSLVFDPDTIIPTGARLEDGYRVGMEYFGRLAPGDRATAVTCFNDLVAIGLLRALRELGLDVPGDVSVVGHDDIDLLNYLPLRLTTVRVPMRQMADRAVQMLIRHIETREPLAPEKVVIETELVVRDSTRSLHDEPTAADDEEPGDAAAP